MPVPLRAWLAAHEAGHVQYIETHGSQVIYAYIDDINIMDGCAELSEPLLTEGAQAGMPAAGAAGELAFYLIEAENQTNLENHYLDLFDRTVSDRNLFDSNIDYVQLNIHSEKDKKNYFIWYAKTQVCDKFIIPNYRSFSAIKSLLETHGFVGRFMLDAVKSEREPNFDEIKQDHNSLPITIRKKLNLLNL